MHRRSRVSCSNFYQKSLTASRFRSCEVPLHFPAFLCRYHYNVANTRVEQHVEKGNDDGLYISSVACCQELWALIMDAGTGFSAQVYNLSNQFLPKEWIMEKWEEGFYITGMAGSMTGSSLVVMSKGTPYTQQSYKVRGRPALALRCT